MAAQLIDGKALARRRLEQVGRDAADWRARHGQPLGLAVVLVGDDPASQVYVRNKRRTCGELGIASLGHDLPASVSEAELLDLVGRLNADPAVDGILVQLPLPKPLRPDRVIEAIDPDKDVDGLHPVNLGRLLAGLPGLVSCTPSGIMELLAETGVPLSGRRAVVVGRSAMVGKPLAQLLLQADATVTQCHSRTRDLAGECRRADILVAAAGRPNLIRGDWIQPGAVVIDVGTTKVDGRLCGDVEFAAARERAAFITPVPGGVGPMTIARLMANTVEAARRRKGEVTA